MLETVAGRANLLSAIEKARNSSVVTYVLHEQALIADDAVFHLYDKLEALGRRERLDLFVVSRGGFTETCWRVLTLLRDYCAHLGVLAPHRAHSGATLIALGADEIVMGPMSELSSTEPARPHPLLPGPDGGPVTHSTGDLPAALALLARQGAAAQDAGLDPAILAAVLAQVHPLAIGALEQARALTRLVARNALALHMRAEGDAARITTIVDALNGGLHSPAYPLARAEATALGLPVTHATGRLWHDMWALHTLYQQALYRDQPDPAQPGAFFRYLALIEGQGRTSGLRQTYVVHEGQERVVGIGWDTAIRSNTPGPPQGPDGVRRN
jgi:hypothetical protein